MAFKFPFTNYHELNLNWVLEELKKLFEDSEENVTTIETYDERLSAVEAEIPTVSATAQDAAQNAAAASTAAQQATATANAAQENATQAQSIAGFARQEAQAAQTAADAATQAAQQATATAQNFDGRITQAQNDASTALEASRSFENRVQSAITTANNAANTATNAQGIAMRADQNAAIALDTLNAQRAELERIGAEQAALITAETEDKKTEIENLAESVLDSIPADYTELSALVDKKAPVIINTASGSIASFNDGADNMKIQKLVVNIEPLQAGSGEPSPVNNRPISGWTGAEIGQTGKNLINIDGSVVLSGASQGWDVHLEAGTYTVSFDADTAGISVACQFRNADNTANVVQNSASTVVGRNAVTIVTTEPIKKFRFYSSGRVTVSNVQLELGSPATAYEPYTGNQISVTFPASAGDSGTVYGATMTLNPDRTGTLVVDGAMADLGTLNWTKAAPSNFRTFSGTLNGIRYVYNETTIMSSAYVGTNGQDATAGADNYAWVDGRNSISIKDTSKAGMSATEFKTAMSGVQLVYKLAAPITFTLTAEQISGILTSLYGVNNIWADTGSVSVDYPADTKLYIDGKLAELQATILENI